MLSCVLIYLNISFGYFLLYRYFFLFQKCRNFFRSFQLAGQEKLKEKRAKEKELGIEPSQKSSESESEKASAKKIRNLFKSNVWYQYKEGYSNAVRRTVLMENLF